MPGILPSQAYFSSEVLDGTSSATRIHCEAASRSVTPLRNAAFEHLQADVARRLPTAPENLDRWLTLDAGFWLERREALTESFDELLSRSR